MDAAQTKTIAEISENLFTNKVKQNSLFFIIEGNYLVKPLVFMRKSCILGHFHL